MPLPIKKICHDFIIFTTDHKRVPGKAFVIKVRKYIDIYQKLVFVKMYIIRTDWIRKGVETISSKHFSSVVNGSF